jgi:hypothetical protein
MTRTLEWSVTRNNENRNFIAHYVDDSSERAKAIACFDDGLFSDNPVDDDLWILPIVAANAFLAANPIVQTFESLYLQRRGDDIGDDDLARLRHVPELRRLIVYSNRITDVGIRYLSSLYRLETIWIGSSLVTDASIETISQLRSLRSLDLQNCCGLTVAAFDSMIAKLPLLVESWGPHQGRIRRST